MPERERAAELRKGFAALPRFNQSKLAEEGRDIAPGDIRLAGERGTLGNSAHEGTPRKIARSGNAEDRFLRRIEIRDGGSMRGDFRLQKTRGIAGKLFRGHHLWRGQNWQGGCCHKDRNGKTSEIHPARMQKTMDYGKLPAARNWELESLKINPETEEK
jgi:hypothetical protein